MDKAHPSNSRDVDVLASEQKSPDLSVIFALQKLGHAIKDGLCT